MNFERQTYSRLSESFIRELKSATTGYISPEDFDRLVNSFEDEIQKNFFSPGVEANIHRIIFSTFDKVSLLSNALKYPHYIQIIIAIAVNSNYLTDIIIRSPEYLYWILSPENLNSRLSQSGLKKTIQDAVSKYQSFNAKINFFRSVKRREILKIGLNDILGNSGLKETTEQLSVLAKGINEELFHLCYNEILTKYGIKSRTVRYCLVALGKLGGNELNYSSDVDFILFFDKNTTLGKIEYFQLLTEATHLFIQTSTAVTGKGYIYRVDFRLRPDGRNSPLCRTLKDYLRYYESRGEDWERQMLIKMSFTGGNKKLYSSFHDYIQNFIYPQSFSRSPLEQIAVMKANIEKHSGEKENVKLFSGGIRDIEFSVQALQLLNGGILKDLRTGNTLEAIDLLTRHGLLSSDEAALFVSAYEFYRKIEHFLQLMNDQQTHIIPKSGEILDKLAHYLNFKKTDAFLHKVEAARKEVRKLFVAITGQKLKQKTHSVEEIKFSDPKKSLSNYNFLQSGLGLLEQKQFDSQTITAFQEIEEVLISFLKHSVSPDLVLDNFARVIKTRPLPSIWFHEFRDKTLFNSFLKICERCQKAVDMMVLDKSFGDLLLGRRVFVKDTQMFESMPVRQTIFMLAVQFSLGFIHHDKVSEILSKNIQNLIAGICSRLALKYNYFIMGMGSFGTGEMTFSSDADIVIVAENVNDFPEIQSDFQKLFAALQDAVRPFELDSRLRPEGKSGQLVWDIKNYLDYVDKRMQTWELQSSTKLKFIFGDRRLFNMLIEKVKLKIISCEKTKIRTDILEMRKKIDKQLSSSPQSHFSSFFNIKKSRGGITDIEFSLQFLILTNPEIFDNTHGRSSLKIINYLLDFSDKFHSFVALKNGYSFLKTIEFWNQILFNINSAVLPLDNKKRQFLAHIAGYSDIHEFETSLFKVIKTDKDLIDEIYNY